tara:strand:+ start:7121 stop:10984 length:3864 start_codon:yes stop_codon:yes gene_type:complete
MAFERRYESTYFSLNGTEYYLEIRDQNWPSGIGVREADLGVGGCAIHYDMEGEQKYSPIIASKMDIPFLVKDGTDAVFIKNLIEDYNEGDVVVALYKGSSATNKPIWAGYLLMDLGAQQDVSYPYEVKITATDGLARLKDIGFWSDEANEITYAHKGHERITYWLGEILNKLTPPGTTQGISQDAIITAAVNWYNEEHDNAGTTFGPLYQTQIKMGMMEDVDTAGNASVRNCYDVLKDLCTTFGMRCIYWKHRFYFIQLDGYNTAESGTLINPTNINTRDYSLADPPVHTASRDYLGTTRYARYNQNIENQTTPGKGIQKLAGTTYQNYPVLKRVSADFITANDNNYYRGFPESTPGPNDTASVGDIVSVTQQFMNDPNSATKLLLRVPLTFQQDTSVGSYNQIYDNYSVKFYCYIKASVPTGASGTGTDPQYLKYSGGSYSWTTTLPAWGEFIILESPSLNASDTGVQILTPFNSNGGELPPFTGITGTWEFEIILQAYMQSGGWKDPVKVYAGTSGTSANGYDYTTHGVKWANALDPAVGVVTASASPLTNGIIRQQWSSPNGNPFLGDLFLLNASLSVGSMGTKVITETNENDTSQLFLGQMFWGDSPMDSDPASILVWDGAAWVFTDPTGEWGIGTITPASPTSLTKLLLKEYLDGQSFHVYKMNARITLSVHEKNSTDASGTRPKYVNPIGRINDVDGKSYIFLRGTFITGDDTWDGEWFNIGRGTPTLTTTTQSIYSLNTPATSSTLPMPAIAGGSGNAGAKLGAPLGITTTSARISTPNEVANPDFLTDTAWTKGTGVTIASDKLQFSSVADGIGATNSETLTIGKEYQVDYTVSGYSAGGVVVKLGDTSGTKREANGTFSENITALTTDTIKILASNPPSWSNVYSVEFDGVDDYSLTDSGFYLAASTSTTSMWFKLNGTGGATTGNNIMYSATAPSDCLIWLWAAGATSYIRVYHPLYGSVIVWGWGITNPTDWHHIVITYNQSEGEMKIYGDGDLKSTTTATVAVHSGYSPAYIGRLSTGTWGIFGGNIDEVGNWSSTLSAAEVTAIYNSGTPTDLAVDAGDYTSSANLDGYWRMGDPDGTSEYPTITDESGEGNDSTMTNMASGDIVEEVPGEGGGGGGGATSTFNIDTLSIVERTTSIPILDIGETLLADNDRITLVDSNSGQVYELRLNAAQTSGQTTLTIDAYTFTEDVESGAFISINSKNLIQQYQNKTEGTTNLAQYSFTEKSADPETPAEGGAVMWMSDGTGTGNDGDILMKIQAGGEAKTFTLVDFSEG